MIENFLGWIAGAFVVVINSLTRSLPVGREEGLPSAEKVWLARRYDSRSGLSV